MIESLPRFIDPHVHFRQGQMMDVIGRSMEYCDHVVAMPNTDPPIITARDALLYKNELFHAMTMSREARAGKIPDHVLHNKRCIMPAIKLIPGITTPAIIDEAAQAEVKLGKLYPANATTNSKDGYYTIEDLFPVFEKMERRGMILSCHGETPKQIRPDANITLLDWESLFLDEDLVKIRNAFPELVIILEHITTAKAVELVRNSSLMYATITAHHLLLTLDDVLANGIRPHNYCKPIAKYPSDKQALRNAALFPGDKFFLGSDSAPHDKNKKENDCGCAGCYTAPIVPQILATVNANCCGKGNLLNLSKFVSTNARRVYQLSGPIRNLVLQEGRTDPGSKDDNDLNLKCFRPNITLDFSLV